MSVRDDVRELLEGVPDERLEDVRTYLEHLRDADCAWKWWQQQHSGSETDERIRLAVAEAEADPRLSVEEVHHRLFASGFDLDCDRGHYTLEQQCAQICARLDPVMPSHVARRCSCVPT